MKKNFSISLALLLLLSVMNISIATHYCGGKVAAVKYSLTGVKASCGMEVNEEVVKETQFTANCCEDEVSVYALKDDYRLSSFQIKEIKEILLQFTPVPVNLFIDYINFKNAYYTNVIPPGISVASTNKLADICVLRL